MARVAKHSETGNHSRARHHSHDNMAIDIDWRAVSSGVGFHATITVLLTSLIVPSYKYGVLALRLDSHVPPLLMQNSWQRRRCMEDLLVCPVASGMGDRILDTYILSR